ncbi:MAG: bifunctional glutamate N-acetyltransferase/amino-acid acetyltransferase ArgJ [Candidatus Latescibacterota bacterium]|nr:bifunctional glutamate N-acetyltransferase/amino-acid acetyltransferase ArgJ [Candidatus Latescibacterota bacterium]MEC8646638.1 bifunctional glutamate N-acetyltransferase/amino-acid acetyltransferase ArgJ [Candidatus Latescibacterota bacterium]MEE2628122.1 bifunctional glutamate N-acetyltransferase/amino-acid acetyltransferase ArgJ [Candidatus Latescibacterota bacterium]
MDVIADGNVCAPRGFRAAGALGGIKAESTKLDVALVASDRIASAAAVYTTNRVQAAPLHLCREYLQDGKAHAVVLNSGNANACTGDQGLDNARAMSVQVGQGLGVRSEDVLVCSTGVIGVQLDMDAVQKGIAGVLSGLQDDGGDAAAVAIMTTDTKPKTSALSLKIGDEIVHVGGMSKGSGMIAPNMATMLGVITTDANVPPDLLREILSLAVKRSFNCITVDGDMSTNDTVIALANGAAGGPPLEPNTSSSAALAEAIEMVCRDLARQIARDGEGATKLVSIEVVGAASEDEARQVGLSVANSNLVKTAVFGRDPNWGRILCAMGYAGVPMDPQNVAVYLCDTQIYGSGSGLPFNHKALVEAMSAADIPIVIDLASGTARAEIFTCDLSYDYVRINAEYTT